MENRERFFVIPAMTRWVCVAAAAIGSFAPRGACAASIYHYLDPQRVQLVMLLPPPPTPMSPQEMADIRQVAAAVAARSPAQYQAAEEESMRSVFFFTPSIGASFQASRLPATTRLFENVRSDVERLIDEAKIYWGRNRPSGARKARGSYPSGHAAFAASTAILLSDLLPAKRDAIFAQARIFADNRILLGVHYPSDVAAGWAAGTTIAFAMMEDRAFQSDFKAAHSELRLAGLAGP
jgi:acid phosphatase (class A)